MNPRSKHFTLRAQFCCFPPLPQWLWEQKCSALPSGVCGAWWGAAMARASQGSLGACSGEELGLQSRGMCRNPGKQLNTVSGLQTAWRACWWCSSPYGWKAAVAPWCFVRRHFKEKPGALSSLTDAQVCAFIQMLGVWAVTSLFKRTVVPNSPLGTGNNSD